MPLAELTVKKSNLLLQIVKEMHKKQLMHLKKWFHKIKLIFSWEKLHLDHLLQLHRLHNKQKFLWLQQLELHLILQKIKILYLEQHLQILIKVLLLQNMQNLKAIKMLQYWLIQVVIILLDLQMRLRNKLKKKESKLKKNNILLMTKTLEHCLQK